MVQYLVHKCPPLVPVLSQINPVNALTTYFLNIHYDILSSMPRFFKWSLCSRFPHQNPVCISPHSNVCNMPCPSHCSWFNHANPISWELQISYAIYSSVKYHQLKFLPLCKRPRFTPIYSNKQNCILKLYFNLLLLNSELKYKRIWTKCKQVFPEFNLVLISSWMQFWFVLAIPKYFNFATLSNGLLLIMLDMKCQKSEADGSDRNSFCSIQKVYLHISWPSRATVLRYNYKTFYSVPH